MVFSGVKGYKLVSRLGPGFLKAILGVGDACSCSSYLSIVQLVSLGGRN